MSDTAELICGAAAYACRCSLPPGHSGAHVCGNDGGSWTGTFGCDDFGVVAWPDPGWNES